MAVFYMDIFCQIKEKLLDQIIDETNNFYVIHDGYPLLEGHLLVIPKKHIDCYLNLDQKLVKEYLKLKEKLIVFYKKNYQEPVIFEHGIAGQTILHAHMHFLPTSKTIENSLNRFGKLYTKPRIPYLYFEYKNKRSYFKPKGNIKPGLIHSFIYPKLLKRPEKGILRAKDLNKWLFEVKKRF